MDRQRDRPRDVEGSGRRGICDQRPAKALKQSDERVQVVQELPALRDAERSPNTSPARQKGELQQRRDHEAHVTR